MPRSRRSGPATTRQSTASGAIARASCQIINQMKTQLSEEEFGKVVIELAGRFETGAPYDRDIIKFEHWNRPR